MMKVLQALQLLLLLSVASKACAARVISDLTAPPPPRAANPSPGLGMANTSTTDSNAPPPPTTQSANQQAPTRTLCNGIPCVANEVLVGFHQFVAGVMVTPVDPPGLQLVRQVDEAGLVLLYRFDVSKEHPDPLSAAAVAQTATGVRFVEPNYIVYTHLVPNDALYATQWGLGKIKASQAWDLSTGDASVTIGITDTGIDPSHPDLSGKVDVLLAPSFFDATDGNGHGSHVAGIIGAATNNTVGVAGTDWKVRLAICKAFDDNGSATIADVVTCIRLLRQSKVTFTSNSWGTYGFSQALFDEVETVCDAGGLFVAAAGNNHINNDISGLYPGSFNLPCVLSVASTSSTDNLSSFSNYGASSVHLGAPGEGILSTWPLAKGDVGHGAGYNSISGTSMATPFVAGAAAMVYGLSGKSLSGVQVKAILMATVDTLSTLNGKTVSGGRLNLFKALSAVPPKPPPPSSPPPPKSPPPSRPPPTSPPPAVLKSPPPPHKKRAPPPPTCTRPIPAYGQCGGIGAACTGSDCVDGPIPGSCCLSPSYSPSTVFVCKPASAPWYYQCRPLV